MCLAIPGRVTEIYRECDLVMGKVDFGGVFKRVCLEHVPEMAVGDYALVHVGFAIARIDEEEARQLLVFLESVGEMEDVAGGGESESEPGRPDSARGRL